MSDFTRSATAVVATILMSAACLAGAVGPAQPGAGKAAVAMAAKIIA